MTNRIVRHIAFFSLLVFAYPIAFMSFHVLHDHLPGDSCVHSCCDHTNHANPEDNGEDSDITQVSENNHCLLCEYEFAKTNTAETQAFFQFEPYSNILCEGFCNQMHPIFSETNKSLRAPPFIA